MADGRRRVELDDGDVEADEVGLIALVQKADRAEVDQADDFAGQDEHVAGVGVGVEEAVVQHFLDDEARGVHGDAVAVEAGGVEGGQIVDLDAAQPLLHHQAARRKFPVDARHVDVLFVREVLAEAVGVAPLAAIVQLFAQGVGELLGHFHRVERHEAGQPLAHQVGDVAEDVEVGVDQALDARPLDFDHHVRAVGQQRRVDLGQRGRGDGRGVEGGEDLR